MSNTYIERAQAISTKGGRKCRLIPTLAELAPAKRRKVEEAIGSRVTPGAALARIFEEDSINISVAQINDHRAGRCLECRRTGRYPRPQS